MTAIDVETLKNQFHYLIDQIDDAEVLMKYVGEINQAVSIQNSNGWDDLSPEDKAGIERALVESKDPSNWIPHEVVKERFAKWLTR